MTYKSTNSAPEATPTNAQWNALPLRARVVDRLADIMLVFNDILDMVQEEREVGLTIEPTVERMWQKINEFSLEVERDLLRDFAN